MFIRRQIRQLKIINRILIRKQILINLVQRFEYLHVVILSQYCGSKFQDGNETFEIYVGLHFESLEVCLFEVSVHVIFALFLPENASKLFLLRFVSFELMPLLAPSFHRSNSLLSLFTSESQGPDNQVAHSASSRSVYSDVALFQLPLHDDILKWVQTVIFHFYQTFRFISVQLFLYHVPALPGNYVFLALPVAGATGGEGQRSDESQVTYSFDCPHCYYYLWVGMNLYLFDNNTDNMQKRVVCGGVCAGLLLALGLFAVLGMQNLVDGVILDGVVLSPQNSDLWGQNPGRSGVTTIRNFTFFNFTNPRGYLYRNERPHFKEISNYVITELSNFTNITYSEDKSYIDYNYWLHFGHHPQSRSLEEEVHVLNLAPIGFWSQLDLVPDSTFAMQGFGGLFVETNRTIIVQALGQGVSGQFLATDKLWKTYCKTLQISEQMCLFLWQDYYYGLGNQNNFSPWVLWLHFNDSDSGNALVSHFGLDQSLVFNLKKLMKPWFSTVQNIINDWYCQGQLCQNYQLAVLQLSRSGLTSNPPSGPAMDSVCQGDNITCKGYPELSAYYKYVFFNQTREKEFYNLTFEWEMASELFSPTHGTLLNIGNLTELFVIGHAFDLAPSNSTLLEELKRVTHGNREQAIVVWEYAKYFTYEFVLKKAEKGGRKTAGMAGIFSQAMYGSAVGFSDWFVRDYLGRQIAARVGNCQQFLDNTTESIASQTIGQMCQQVDTQHLDNYYKLAQPCLNPLTISQYKSNYSLTDLALSQLCDSTQLSLLTVATQAHQYLSHFYNCSRTHRCTPTQLSAKQLFNSSITRNPIHPQIYSPSTTAHSWNNELEEFQYRHFLKEVYGDVEYDEESFGNVTKVASLMSFDKFYSVPGMQDLMLAQEGPQFYEKYCWKNKTLLMEYIRFVVIEVGFGGLTQKRTPNELIFGYTDPFLSQLKQLPPILGGDPSIQTTVMVNDPNITLQASHDPQSVYTGYSNATLTRQFISNYHRPYVNYNKTYFDGYNIISQQVSPYRKEVPLHGTDAMQNMPMCSPEDSQYIYVDNLYRVAEVSFVEETEKYGFGLYRYKISDRQLASEKQYPPNENYYQKYEGTLNLSFLGVPMLASKNHWYTADQYWMDQVDIFDQSSQHKQLANQYDQVRLLIEPKSGATFQATLYLQSSVYFLPDMLFPHNQILLPVVTVYRSANISQQMANELLGDLKVALAAPRAIGIFSFSAMLVVIAATSCCLIRKSRKHQSMPSLLESTENALLEHESHPDYSREQEEPDPQPVRTVRTENEESEKGEEKVEEKGSENGGEHKVVNQSIGGGINASLAVEQ